MCNQESDWLESVTPRTTSDKFEQTGMGVRWGDMGLDTPLTNYPLTTVRCR